MCFGKLRTQFNAFLSRIFDYRSKVSRLPYLCFHAASWLTLFALSTPAFTMGASLLGADPFYFYEVAGSLWFMLFTLVWGVVSVILSTFFICGVIFLTIQRLNDMRLSRWFLLMLAVPVVNFVWVLILLVFPSRNASAEEAE